MGSTFIAGLSVFIHTQGKKFVTDLSHFLYMWFSYFGTKNIYRKFFSFTTWPFHQSEYQFARSINYGVYKIFQITAPWDE